MHHSNRAGCGSLYLVCRRSAHSPWVRVGAAGHSMLIGGAVAQLKLLQEIRGCRACENELPLGPRPVVSFARSSLVMVVGQAPGTKVHASGIPWNDPSGDRLRAWMHVTPEAFYDPKNFAIVPMGFCYPGKGRSGDLPPRPECSTLWMEKIRNELKGVQLTILIGQYAHRYFLGDRRKRTLTETVKAWRCYGSELFVLPHPSGRNNIWMKKNPWFEQNTIPALRRRVARALKKATAG